jgi:hypothetical protein
MNVHRVKHRTLFIVRVEPYVHPELHQQQVVHVVHVHVSSIRSRLLVVGQMPPYQAILFGDQIPMYPVRTIVVLLDVKEVVRGPSITIQDVVEDVFPELSSIG